MKGRTPNGDEQRFMDRAREYGCVVCKWHLGIYTPPAIHHIDGKTKPGAHFHVLGLCYEHHQGGEVGPARHKNKAEFEAAYGTEGDLYLRLVGELQ